MIVADTNLLVHLTIPSRAAPAAERVFARDPKWGAPILWRSEFTNVLATNMRAGHFQIAEARTFVRLARSTLADREFISDTDEVLHLAVQSRCSSYDCEFVAIALRLGTVLVTADRQLQKRFPNVAVDPRDFG